MINKTQNKIISDMNANYRAISKPESNFIYVTNIGGNNWSIWKGSGCDISFGEKGVSKDWQMKKSLHL
jgi:hypothetical protein